MKMCLVVLELLRTDGQRDRHDEVFQDLPTLEDEGAVFLQNIGIC
jgi:hypothetical protein